MNIYSYTQHTLLQLFITWQLVLIPDMDHHQAFIQEHECIQKLNIVSCRSPVFTLKMLVSVNIHIVVLWPDDEPLSRVKTSCQVINNHKGVCHV
jgi:hypothetical protein